MTSQVNCCPSCGREGWDDKFYYCKVECAECGMTIDGDSRDGCPFCGSYEQNAEYNSNGECILN